MIAEGRQHLKSFLDSALTQSSGAQALGLGTVIGRQLLAMRDRLIVAPRCSEYVGEEVLKFGR